MVIDESLQSMFVELDDHMRWCLVGIRIIVFVQLQSRQLDQDGHLEDGIWILGELRLLILMHL